MSVGFFLLMLLTACAPAPTPALESTVTPVPTPTYAPPADVTPLPTRGPFDAGQLLAYTVQTGDTVLAVAAHFNTTPAEVLTANPGLGLTRTLTPGALLNIPAYYFSLGGPTFKIISDGEFVYGPANKDFDVAAYLETTPGWLKHESAYAGQVQRTAAETLVYVSQQYSINPKLLLALLEWRAGALSNPNPAPGALSNPLGLTQAFAPEGFYLQSLWAAEQLSVGYYGWRSGALTFIPLSEGYRSRVDMYQNAATVGVQYFLAQLAPYTEFETLAGPAGLAQTYTALWGNPFPTHSPPPEVLPGDLTQPGLMLPFGPGQVWTFTGGPHPGWGENLPWAALDFAPPAGESGCIVTNKPVTASAPGVIVRSADNTVILDLDGDGYEQTGWVLFYFHIAREGRVAAGISVKVGDPLGYPSCEGGQATGTHVHLARKYNGEWIPATGIAPGVMPFDLGGWTAEAGAAPYKGRLMRVGAWVEASTVSSDANRIYWTP